MTVQVKQPDGSLAPVSRTLYETEFGPIFNSLQGQAAVRVDDEHRVRAVRRERRQLRGCLNHYFDTNHAQSTKELLKILKKYEGIPWVNTIASDSKGKALYADIGSVPNVDNAKATDCASALRPGHVRAARPADARRLALGVRADDRSRCGRRRA